MVEETHILDTIMGSRQSAALREFNPQALVSKHLENLKAREIQVVTSRYGLHDGNSQTLESIGKRLGLTRERIRQLEKDAVKKLQNLPASQEWGKGVDLIFQIIEEHGNVAREDYLLTTLKPTTSPSAQQAILFILNLMPRFNLLKEPASYYQSWYLDGFDKEAAEQTIAYAISNLEEQAHPIPTPELLSKIRSKTQGLGSWTDKALESMLLISKKIDRNPFSEWGLKSWSEINPKDVGDKSYLVLKHNGKPEHYSKITEMINKQGFDSRVAHKETVHNELIKDERFVLVGRGIYALSEWGYKKGAVSDIIRDVIGTAGKPLSKEEIIQEVLKQRMVKKNTVIVGLSNKKLFQKTESNKFLNAV